MGVDGGPGAQIYEKELSFANGDQLILYTDGVTETMNATGELFGSERFAHLLLDKQSASESLNDRVLTELKRFGGGKFQDDIFLIHVNLKKTG